jgi:hypothetical protein
MSIILLFLKLLLCAQLLAQLNHSLRGVVINSRKKLLASSSKIIAKACQFAS